MKKGHFVAVAYPPEFVRDEVDGKKVVKDEVLASGLSGYKGRLIPIHGIRVLTLEDGSVVHGCRSCRTEGTRGQIMAHLTAFHSVNPASRRGSNGEVRQLPFPKGAQLSMTVYELIEMAESVGEWEEVLTNMEAENERLRELVAERTAQLKTEQREHQKLQNTLARLVGGKAGGK
jgi:hypothetical protein